MTKSVFQRLVRDCTIGRITDDTDGECMMLTVSLLMALTIGERT